VTEKEIIQKWVRKILDGDGRNIKEGVEAANKMMTAVRMHRQERRWARSMNIVDKKRSLPAAANYYNSPGREEWIKARKKRYKEDQLAFVDTISPWYFLTMSNLTGLQAKIMDCILSAYREGICVREIAKRSWMDSQTVSGYLKKLKKANLVASKVDPKDKRRSIYYMPDVNWYRVHAIRWDGRFRRWLDENRNKHPEDLVDRFINEMEQLERKEAQI